MAGNRRGLLVRHGLLALALTSVLLSVLSVAGGTAPSAFADASPAPVGTGQLITVSAPSAHRPAPPRRPP